MNQNIEPQEEYILCAANQVLGIIYPGYRHKQCEELMERAGVKIAGREHQGFLTSHHRWVSRKDAWHIAKCSGQIEYGFEASDRGDDSELISENLYMTPDEL